MAQGDKVGLEGNPPPVMLSVSVGLEGNPPPVMLSVSEASQPLYPQLYQGRFLADRRLHP